MKIPKITFKPMTLEDNIEIIKWAYFEDNGSLSVHHYTVQYFPELAQFDKNLSKNEIYKIIEKVVTDDYMKYVDRIKIESERYNKIWKKYNDKYFEMLSTYFNIEWPEEVNVITATVGLIPVFPRYLDSFSFSISTGVKDEKLIETSAHETLHFMWFEKWKKLHPETPRREYDSPYITWRYSEMVTDPILNNKPFNGLFSNLFVEKGYDIFYKQYDDEELVMDKLRKIYEQEIPIEDKINLGFKYIKNIEKNNTKT